MRVQIIFESLYYRFSWNVYAVICMTILESPVLFRYKRPSSLSFALFMVVRLSQIFRKYVRKPVGNVLLCLYRFLLDWSLRGMMSYSTYILSMLSLLSLKMHVEC